MSGTPLRWRLVTINTFGTWLHGNPRGFRSRGHRIHSSGDYRNPPPKGEHEGLFNYMIRHSRDAVKLPAKLRPIVGNALVEFLGGHFTLLVSSVASDHSHHVIKLPNDVAQMRKVIGDAKRKSSRAIKAQIPGAVWSSGADFEPLDDRSHWENAIRYVLFKQGAGAWIGWSEKILELGIDPDDPNDPGWR